MFANNCKLDQVDKLQCCVNFVAMDEPFPPLAPDVAELTEACWDWSQ